MKKGAEYRNNVDLFSLEGIFVDQGSLWKFDPELNLLILVDDDQFATMPMSNIFELA